MKAIKIFWTGGWDSSFRVLQLVSNKYSVQPIYVVDVKRGSYKIELETMREMRANIETRYGKDLILPTIIGEKDHLKDDKTITDKFFLLRKKYPFLGNQYEWLHRYILQAKINEKVELCIERDSRLLPILKKHLIKREDGVYELNKDTSSLPLGLDLFEPYSYPILDFYKVEMKEYAQKEKFLDIILGSWFCFFPKKGKPCGVCSPCRQAIRAKMGWRIPLNARMRYIYTVRKEQFYQRSKNFLLKYKIGKQIKNIYNNRY